MTPARFRFTPKEGGEDWTASIETTPTGSGFDVVLMLDRADTPSEDSGWMLELAIGKDGSVSGQIVAHPGYDALAVFDCTQDTLRISGNCAGPQHIISDLEGK